MKSLYLLCLALGSTAFAQTITFNGCHNLFDNQNYTFNKTGVDTYGKGIYMTTPIDGQDCSGLGTCEFKLQWNNTLTRWEFLADEGYGTFTSPILIYYNSTGNNSALNPPGNTIGTWTENTSATGSQCGGNLTGANSTMSGDVHTSMLATSEAVKGKIRIFPNPVSDFISISGIENGKLVQVYTMAGQLAVSEVFDRKINVTLLSPGIYLLRITTKDSQTYEFKFVKK
ncbi:hypothetical protein HNP38_002983 [Chryseobacterium defluvii]|uniref:Secretion system C-terminal sorting domain-containing protein n=1 Tax=Chryseobacterium defluvii TaxID=160396 RepID=A0A840KIB3_9FLAO|nr:T9SS type A sorting domain-containing protein [Chryseobacterium defluvii]MBB4807677.1 hypothetical protein [Chryseobacterium defluvii]